MDPYKDRLGRAGVQSRGADVNTQGYLSQLGEILIAGGIFKGIPEVLHGFCTGRWRLGICMPAERQRGERPSASTSALETYEREMADRGTSRCGARIYQ